MKKVKKATVRLPNITEDMWDDAFQALLALNGYLSSQRKHKGSVADKFVFPMACMDLAEEAIRPIVKAGYKPRSAAQLADGRR